MVSRIAAVAIAAASAVASAAEPRLVVGAPLVAITGSDLAGRSVTLPAATKGRVAFVAFGFSYAARTPVEAWSAHVRKAWGHHAGFMWYQVPMIGGLGRLAKPFITGGMKKATAPEEYGHSVTVFGGVGGWKQRLAVTDDQLAYLVLIDEGGVVRWLHAGPLDAARADELDRAIKPLVDRLQ